MGASEDIGGAQKTTAGSWAVLHFALRRRQVGLKTWFAAFLGMLVLGTLLLWPPVWHMLKGG